MATSHHSDDQAGRNATKRNPAGNCQPRQAEASIDSSTEHESRYRGNRQSGDGLVPDVLGHISVPHCAIE